MKFDDPRWNSLHGGYRVPYDPRKALSTLEQGNETESAWQELCTELYHQGDVGEASYAAVPHLVRIHAVRGVPDVNTYALVGMIEEARLCGRNPALPPNLRDAYDAAWRQLIELGLHELGMAEDRELVSYIIGVIAIAKGQLALGRLSINFNDDERKELLKEAGWIER